jgi:hypothetical protein
MAAVVEKQVGVIIRVQHGHSIVKFYNQLPVVAQKHNHEAMMAGALYTPKTSIEQEQKGMVIGDPLGSF